MDWTTYYLDIAETVSKKASCLRANVGCIIVKDKQIVSTGYNGAPRGRENCLKKNICYRDTFNIKSGTNLEKCHASGAHAEMNAIVNAARHGVAIDGADMYLCGHDACCQGCQAAILNANINSITIRDRGGVVTKFVPRIDFSKHLLDIGPIV